MPPCGGDICTLKEPSMNLASYIKIYTDWANHYLERSPRHKRLIQDLQLDITDGVLLADIIEAVTNERLRDIRIKPKNATQMLENINVCLKCIENLGVNIDGLTAEDIRQGNLRTILGLFFSLSRHKQQQKSIQQTVAATPPHPATSDVMLSKLPSAFKPTNSNRNSTGTIAQSACVPSGGQNRRSLTNAQKEKASTNGPTSGIPAPRVAQPNRSISPGAGSPSHSFIPAPTTKLPSSAEKTNRQNRSNSSISSGVSAVSLLSKSVNPPQGWPTSSHPSATALSTSAVHETPSNMGKNSMFTGFGFFHKNKQEKDKPIKTSALKPLPDRGSGSSSGFSSAKSADNSDSSVAGSETLCTSPNFSQESFPSGHPKETIYENTTTTVTSSPKLAMKALAKKTFSKSTGSKESPKLLRIEPHSADLSRNPTEPGGSLPDTKLPTSTSEAAKRTGKGVTAAVKSDSKIGRRDIQRPFDSSIATVIEEELSCHPKSENRNGSLIKTNSETTPVRRPSTALVKTPSTSTTPTTPTSGIPRPSVAVKAPPKLVPSTAIVKPEKRLSFPPREPAAVSTQEVMSHAVTDRGTAAPDSSHQIPQPLKTENDENSFKSANQECTDGGIKSANLPMVNKTAPDDAVARTDSTGGNFTEVVKNDTAENSLCLKSGYGKAASVSAHNEQPVWTVSHSLVETTFDSTPENKVTTIKSAATGVTSHILQCDSSETASLNSENTTDSMESVLMVKPMAALSRNISMTPHGSSLNASPLLNGKHRDTFEMNNSESGQVAGRVPTNHSPRGGKAESRQSSSVGKPNINNCDINMGYLSDGDVLKSTSVAHLRIFDDDSLNGYLSEGSGGSYSKRIQSKQKEKMPVVREQPRSSKSPKAPGTCEGVDLEENGLNGNIGKDRVINHDSSSHFDRLPYPGLTRHTNNDTGDFPNTSPYSSFPQQSLSGMPLLRGFSAPNGSNHRTEDGSVSNKRPRPPATPTPPPRDPETTLSTNPRLTNGGTYKTGQIDSGVYRSGQMDGGSYRNGHDVDNYLRIYASPVRKPRQAPKDMFAIRNERNPGDLCARPVDMEKNAITSLEGMNGVKPLGALERRTKLKVSGSTQTNPQELQFRAVAASGSCPYSTNSLNRNLALGASKGVGGSYQQETSSGPPRCRSVVHTHVELSIPTATPIFSDNGDYDCPVPGNHPVSPRPNNSTGVRFSASGHEREREMSMHNGDSDRYYTTGNISNTAALPPKSSRHRAQNGHGDSGIYDKLHHNGTCQKPASSSTGTSEIQFHNSTGPLGMSGWDRASSHSSSPKHDFRGYPLSSSINTHHFNHADDLDDDRSTASFPLSGTSRSSAPGSPLLMYSLPRQNHSTSSQRNKPGNVTQHVPPYVGSLLAKIHAKDDEIHGSALSLASTNSSMYSSPEERHAYEVRKLRRELEQAQERVTSLTMQLGTNDHLVAAFESHLDNLNQRLDFLTSNAQRKDGELSELRKIIDILRQQGAQAGLIGGTPVSPSLVRRHTFNSSKDALSENQEKLQGLSRQLSTDSVTSLNSMASNCSTASHHLDEEGKKKKKKSWVKSSECAKVKSQLRSSFIKTFSRGRSKSKTESTSDAESGRHDLSTSVPNSPLLQNNRSSSRIATSGMGNGRPVIKPAISSSALDRMDERDEVTLVEDLQRQLREREMMITDFQLQSVKSAQQMDQYKEDVLRMRSEMEILRQDNVRLHRLIAAKRRSLSSERKSPHDGGARSTPSESGIGDDESPTFDARRISVKVITAEDDTLHSGKEQQELSIGSVKVGPLLRWEQLDKTVRQIFKEYIARLDVKRDASDVRDQTGLGLSTDSIDGYYLGTALRNKDDPPSIETSPIDYVKNDDETIRVVLKGSRDHAVDTVCFDSLIPKTFFLRYISLITEHKRVILCGPSGTGKSYLARKIAQHLIVKTGSLYGDGAIATFSVDQKSCKDLRQYLLQVAEQCENNSAVDIPKVVIIDNLHHVNSLGEVFNGFLSVKHHRCPYIIGTMNQATCSPTNLQLHHNFRWILCANHMEPVRGLLGRYLRRKLIEHEISAGVSDSALIKIVHWVPKAWSYLNTFLEKHNSSDVTIGPQLLLDCPMDIRDSQDWFTSTWNYSLVPYILEAVKEGLRLYGRCATWEDPTEWILQNYPWPPCDTEDDPANHSLNRLRPEDVGFETYGINNGNKAPSNSFVEEVQMDPLSNMLLQLQEAARYSSRLNNQDTVRSDIRPQETTSKESMHL